jgi:hypothetical protein
MILLWALLAAAISMPAQERKTRNVIFVMTDGFRWQEAVRGADPELMDEKRGSVSDIKSLKSDYWRDTAAERRQALLPFLWTVVQRQGQIYGNRDLKSDAYVTNGLNFSYPGYSEVSCGFPDPRIDSNDKKPNPNVNVLEWLNRKPAFAGRIAAFAAWDVFPYIFNTARSGLLVNSAFTPFTEPPVTPLMEAINLLKRETAVFDDEALDAFTFHTAIEYFKNRKPRVLFLSLGETDDWAHGGRYDLYLRAAHRFDDYVRQLWETAQAMPEYRGSTTLILAVDHGRGWAPEEWKSHGEKIPDSKYVWMAFMGPDTPALGERAKTDDVTQSQVAATLASFLGEDYRAAEPKTAKPIADAVAPRAAKDPSSAPRKAR